MVLELFWTNTAASMSCFVLTLLNVWGRELSACRADTRGNGAVERRVDMAACHTIMAIGSFAVLNYCAESECVGRYVGQWLNNKKEGQGVLTTKDGKRYEGNFYNNKKEGQGSESDKCVAVA